MLKPTKSIDKHIDQTDETDEHTGTEKSSTTKNWGLSQVKWWYHIDIFPTNVYILYEMYDIYIYRYIYAHNYTFSCIFICIYIYIFISCICLKSTYSYILKTDLLMGF